MIVDFRLVEDGNLQILHPLSARAQKMCDKFRVDSIKLPKPDMRNTLFALEFEGYEVSDLKPTKTVAQRGFL